MSDFAGKQFGRYFLTDRIAVGGMAEIYRAKTFGVNGFEKQLAIKRILPSFSADNDFTRMLIDEAKLTVLLSHANVVQVYDLGKVGEDYFISMEFINGTSLRELMHRLEETKEQIPHEIAVYTTSEVCKGLDYAHRKTDNDGKNLGIVHRDISPHNILLSYEGEVKIVDFGIAKAALNVSQTIAGILKGKVSYMSPEQALGNPVDHRTDIFSCGLLLYEMMAGEKLFMGDSQFEILKKIRTTRITTLALPDAVPGPLKGILAKALAYNPKDRYQSAGDFQIELTKYLYSSYFDFSPRLLAALLARTFKRELDEKRRFARAEVLDEKTRSAILSTAPQESIVAREPTGDTISEVISIGTSQGRRGPITGSETKLQRMRRTTAIVAGIFGLVALGTITGMNFGPIKRWALEALAGLPAATEYGTVQVLSEPLGAEILVDGRPTGRTTPALLDKVEIGVPHVITLKKGSFKEAEHRLTLTSKDPVPVVSRLEALETPPEATSPQTVPELPPATAPPAPSPITVAATPQPAPAPEPPPTTPPAPAVEAKTEPKTVVEGFGEIALVSDPPQASIFINGKPIPLKTPTLIKRVSRSKTYQIRLEKDGYQPWETTVSLADEPSKKFKATLKK